MVYHVAEAAESDLTFAHDLARDNMAAYGVTHERPWDTSLFVASWPQTENLLVLENGARVGILRLSQDERALFVHDLQILPGCQNRGAGTFAMNWVQRLAVGRGLPLVQLRAFVDNPARRLYERLGFREVSSDGRVVLLQRS